MFLVNSRLSHFSVTPSSSRSKFFHRPEHPFFRSYGANWSSSLRGVLPSALEYSSHPPVSVYGTDTGLLTRGFSRQYGIKQSVSPEGSTSLHALELCRPDLPRRPPARLARLFQQTGVLSSCVTPSLKRIRGGTGIFAPVFHRLRLSASA